MPSDICRVAVELWKMKRSLGTPRGPQKLSNSAAQMRKPRPTNPSRAKAQSLKSLLTFLPCQPTQIARGLDILTLQSTVCGQW